MSLRYVCVWSGLLLLQSSWLLGQDANPNSRLRKSGQQSGSYRQPEVKPQSGNNVSASASASASGFGFGQGGGYGQGNGMGFGQNYGNPMQANRGMGFGNGIGFGSARAQASVTANGAEPKSARPSTSRSANKSQADSKASSSGKKNRSASYVDGDRMISVTESKSKIKVTISNEATDEENSYSAKNVAELEKKFPEAYEAYKLAIENDDEEKAADAKGVDSKGDAESLMEEQLKKLEAEAAGNPAMQQMLQQMRREMGR